MQSNTAETTPRTHAEVLDRYEELRLQHLSRYDTLAARQRTFLLALGAVGVIIVVQTANALHSHNSAWPMLLSFIAATVLIVLLVRLQYPVESTRRLILFYDRSILRAEGTAPYSERTGEDAVEPGDTPHLYQRDLDMTGTHSVFSLLATVRTGIGERGLARYLLNPATHRESVKRQQAVRELLPQTALRERITLLGQSSFQQLSASFFDEWLDAEPPYFHPAFRYALLLTATLAVALLIIGIFQIRTWGELLPNLLAVLAIQAAIAMAIRPRVTRMLEGGARLQGQIRLFAEGITLLQHTHFTSPRLLELQQLSREPAGAEKLLKRLDGWLVVVEQRTKELFLVFSLLTASGCQAAIFIANWRRNNAPAMRLWLAAWAEFEALNAIATYAFEHPEDAWPELLPDSSEPILEANALGHPLLVGSVANDIAFSPGHRFYLISGSNMAGKSTLMRSVGVAAVLAYAGAPVRAASLRLSPLAVGASIALVDSLAEGKSKFLAEVERLSSIVKTSRTRPTLFLVDEIFSGTNSADRHTAAAAVLHRLLDNGAIGALSTHDLALTSLANPENHGTNVHMASPNPSDPLAFDYILKPGINQSSNALAIIHLIGLDED